MKKEEVYKIIEYDGIYDEKVKKNLKKLIKKYHPDKNKKDKKTIEIIYEVKKELENNNVSYKPKKSEVKDRNKFISEEECLRNINRLEKIERGNNKELDKMYDDLSNTFKDYRNLYRKLCLNKNQFCILEDEFKKNRNVCLIQKIIFLVLIFLLIINIVLFNIIYIIVFVILIIILVLYYIYYNKHVSVITNNIKKVSVNISKKSKEINSIQDKIKKLTEDIHSLERKNNNVRNDIRFYKNMKEK